MKGRIITTVSVGVLSSLVAIAQSQVPRLPAKTYTPASVQAPADPGYEALTKTCKTPPAGRGRGGAGGRGAAGGRGPAPAAGVRDVKSEAIPGVIAAGQQWKFLWQEEGNNGDGIVGTNDGGLLLAQNDNSKVVKLDKNGKPKVVYADTHTGGALSQNSKKQLFIVERGLHNRIEQLEPQRKVFADKYNGEPLDCIGGVINDITARATAACTSRWVACTTRTRKARSRSTARTSRRTASCSVPTRRRSTSPTGRRWRHSMCSRWLAEEPARVRTAWRGRR
jgi:hypothetical protein